MSTTIESKVQALRQLADAYERADETGHIDGEGWVDITALEIAALAEIESAEPLFTVLMPEPIFTVLMPDPLDERSGLCGSLEDWEKLRALTSGTKLYAHPPIAQAVPEGFKLTKVDGAITEKLNSCIESANKALYETLIPVSEPIAQAVPSDHVCEIVSRINRESFGGGVRFRLYIEAHQDPINVCLPLGTKLYTQPPRAHAIPEGWKFETIRGLKVLITSPAKQRCTYGLDSNDLAFILLNEMLSANSTKGGV